MEPAAKRPRAEEPAQAPAPAADLSSGAIFLKDLDTDGAPSEELKSLLANLVLGPKGTYRCTPLVKTADGLKPFYFVAPPLPLAFGLSIYTAPDAKQSLNAQMRIDASSTNGGIWARTVAAYEKRMLELFFDVRRKYLGLPNEATIDEIRGMFKRSIGITKHDREAMEEAGPTAKEPLPQHSLKIPLQKSNGMNIPKIPICDRKGLPVPFPSVGGNCTVGAIIDPYVYFFGAMTGFGWEVKQMIVLDGINYASQFIPGLYQ